MVQQLPNSRPLTPRDQQEGLAPLRDALRQVLDTTGDIFVDRPAFVASDEPVNPLSSAVRAVTRLNCRIWAANDKSNYSTRVNQGNAQICGPYLQGLNELPVDGGAGVEFSGGQCRKRYLVNFTVTGGSSCADFNSQPVTQDVQLWGPIGGGFIGENLCPPGFAVRGRAFIRAFSVAGGNDVGAPVNAQVSGSADSIVINNVTVIDGSPDDCGNPPPTIRPPSSPVPRPTISPTVNVNLPGLGDVNINVDLDDEGNPVVCIPELDVCFTLDDGDDGGAPDGGGGGIAGGDGLPGTPDAVGDPAFSGEPGDGGEDVDFGPPPDGRVWVGAIARFLDAGGVGVIPSTATANRAYTSVVGNLSLRYGNQRSEARQVRSEWCEAFRPVTSLVVTGAFVNSLPGTGVTLFPVSAIVCPEDICGVDDGG